MSNAEQFRASRAKCERIMLQLKRLQRFAGKRWHWWFRYRLTAPRWFRGQFSRRYLKTVSLFNLHAMRTTALGLFAAMDGLAAPSEPKDPADWWKGDAS